MQRLLQQSMGDVRNPRSLSLSLSFSVSPYLFVPFSPQAQASSSLSDHMPQTSHAFTTYENTNSHPAS